jgi:hypothetical protein
LEFGGIGGIIGAGANGRSRMKPLPYMLLLISIVWIVSLFTISFYGAGIHVPGWMPPSMILPTLAVLAAILLLGWIAPMVAGVWLLIKKRRVRISSH